MRILLVAQSYHPCVGGVETHVRQIAHEMRRLGHCVRVAAGNFGPYRGRRRAAVLHDSLLAEAHSDYDDEGVPVHALTPSATDRLRLLPIAVRALPRLQRYAHGGLKRFGYGWYRGVYLRRLRELASEADVVHSLAGGYLGWTAQEAAASAGVPFVTTPFCHPHQWGDGDLDVKFYCRADAVIGLVQTDRDYLAEIGVPENKLNVVGVSPDVVSGSSGAQFRSANGLGDAPVVLYVGRMMAQKGAAALLAAAQRVWTSMPEVRFVFIGPASLQESEKFADRDPRVIYLGRVPAETKSEALAACDVFCLPSISEILPTVYLEAWTFGKPVVGGDAPGLRELVEDNRGGLTVSQEPEEIASALLKLLKDPDLRDSLGENGRLLVEERYSVGAVTGSLLAIYRSLTCKTSVAPGNAA